MLTQPTKIANFQTFVRVWRWNAAGHELAKSLTVN
jgi:hypothetical protein